MSLVQNMEISKKYKKIENASKVAALANNLEPEGLTAVINTIDKTPVAKNMMGTLLNLSNYGVDEPDFPTYNVTESYRQTRAGLIDLIAPDVEKRFTARLSTIKGKTEDAIQEVSAVVDYARKKLAAVSNNHLENEVREILENTKIEIETEKYAAQRKINELKRYASSNVTEPDKELVNSLYDLKEYGTKTLKELSSGKLNITMAYEKDRFAYNRVESSTHPRGTHFTREYVELTAPLVGDMRTNAEILNERSKLK